MTARFHIQIILSAIWFLIALTVGIWLIANNSVGRIIPQSGLYTYGADFYTGVQNAVAYTERAVVGLHNSFRAQTDYILTGIGWLVIFIGALPLFATSIAKSTTGRIHRFSTAQQVPVISPQVHSAAVTEELQYTAEED